MTDLHGNQPRIIELYYFKASIKLAQTTPWTTQLAEKQCIVEYFLHSIF